MCSWLAISERPIFSLFKLIWDFNSFQLINNYIKEVYFTWLAIGHLSNKYLICLTRKNHINNFLNIPSAQIGYQRATETDISNQKDSPSSFFAYYSSFRSLDKPLVFPCSPNFWDGSVPPLFYSSCPHVHLQQLCFTSLSKFEAKVLQKHTIETMTVRMGVRKEE